MTPMPPYTTDTSPEAESIQLEPFRRMSPTECLAKMSKLSASLRRMAFDAIRRIHPELNEAEVRLKFIESTYGKELAAEVRNHLQQREMTCANEKTMIWYWLWDRCRCISLSGRPDKCSHLYDGRYVKRV